MNKIILEIIIAEPIRCAVSLGLVVILRQFVFFVFFNPQEFLSFSVPVFTFAAAIFHATS